VCVDVHNFFSLSIFVRVSVSESMSVSVFACVYA